MIEHEASTGLILIVCLYYSLNEKSAEFFYRKIVLHDECSYNHREHHIII